MHPVSSFPTLPQEYYPYPPYQPVPLSVSQARLSELFPSLSFGSTPVGKGIEDYLHRLIKRFPPDKAPTRLAITGLSALSFSSPSIVPPVITFYFEGDKADVLSCSILPLVELAELLGKAVSVYAIKHAVGYHYTSVERAEECYCTIRLPLAPVPLTLRLVECCYAPTAIEQCAVDLDLETLRLHLLPEQQQRAYQILDKGRFAVDTALALRQYQGIYTYCDLVMEGYTPHSVFAAENAYCEGLESLRGLDAHLRQFSKALQKPWLQNLERIFFCSTLPKCTLFLSEVRQRLASLQSVNALGCLFYLSPPLFSPIAPFDAAAYLRSLLELLRNSDPNYCSQIMRDQHLQLVRAGEAGLLKEESFFKGFWAHALPQWKRAALDFAKQEELVEVLDETIQEPELLKQVIERLQPKTVLLCIARGQLPGHLCKVSDVLYSILVGQPELLNGCSREERVRLLSYLEGRPAADFLLPRLESWERFWESKQFFEALADQERTEAFLKELESLLRLLGIESQVVEGYTQSRCSIEQKLANERLEQKRRKEKRAALQAKRRREEERRAAECLEQERFEQIVTSLTPSSASDTGELGSLIRSRGARAVLDYAQLLLQGVSPLHPYAIESQFVRNLPEAAELEKWIAGRSLAEKKSLLINLRRILFRFSLQDGPFGQAVEKALEELAAVKATGALFFAVPCAPEGGELKKIAEQLRAYPSQKLFVQRDLSLQGLSIDLERQTPFDAFYALEGEEWRVAALVLATPEELERVFLSSTSGSALRAAILRQMKEEGVGALFESLWKEGEYDQCRDKELIDHLPEVMRQEAFLVEKWGELKKTNPSPQAFSRGVALLKALPTKAQRKKNAVKALFETMELEDPQLGGKRAWELFDRFLAKKQTAEAASLFDRFGGDFIRDRLAPELIDRFLGLLSLLQEPYAVLDLIIAGIERMDEGTKTACWVKLIPFVQADASAESKEKLITAVESACCSERTRVGGLFAVASALLSAEVEQRGKRVVAIFLGFLSKRPDSFGRVEMADFLDKLSAFLAAHWRELPLEGVEALLEHLKQKKIRSVQAKSLVYAMLDPFFKSLKTEKSPEQIQQFGRGFLSLLRRLMALPYFSAKELIQMTLDKILLVEQMDQPLLWEEDFAAACRLHEKHKDLSCAKDTQFLAQIDRANVRLLNARLESCCDQEKIPLLMDSAYMAIEHYSLLFPSFIRFAGSVFTILDLEQAQQAFLVLDKRIRRLFAKMPVKIISVYLCMYYYLRKTPRIANEILGCAIECYERSSPSSLPCHGVLNNPIVFMLIQLMRALLESCTSVSEPSMSRLGSVLALFRKIYLSDSERQAKERGAVRYSIDLVEDPELFIGFMYEAASVSLKSSEEGAKAVYAFLEELVERCGISDGLAAQAAELKIDYDTAFPPAAKLLDGQIKQTQENLSRAIQGGKVGKELIPLFEAFARAVVLCAEEGDTTLCQRVHFLYGMVRMRLSKGRERVSLLALTVQVALLIDSRGEGRRGAYFALSLKALLGQGRTSHPLVGGLLYLSLKKALQLPPEKGGLLASLLVRELFLEETRISFARSLLAKESGAALFDYVCGYLSEEREVVEDHSITTVQELFEDLCGEESMCRALSCSVDGALAGSFDTIKQRPFAALESVYLMTKAFLTEERPGLLNRLCITRVNHLTYRYFETEGEEVSAQELMTLLKEEVFADPQISRSKGLTQIIYCLVDICLDRAFSLIAACPEEVAFVMWSALDLLEAFKKRWPDLAGIQTGAEAPCGEFFYEAVLEKLKSTKQGSYSFEAISEKMRVLEEEIQLRPQLEELDPEVVSNQLLLSLQSHIPETYRSCLQQLLRPEGLQSVLNTEWKNLSAGRVEALSKSLKDLQISRQQLHSFLEEMVDFVENTKQAEDSTKDFQQFGRGVLALLRAFDGDLSMEDFVLPSLITLKIRLIKLIEAPLLWGEDFRRAGRIVKCYGKGNFAKAVSFATYEFLRAQIDRAEGEEALREVVGQLSDAAVCSSIIYDETLPLFNQFVEKINAVSPDQAGELIASFRQVVKKGCPSPGEHFLFFEICAYHQLKSCHLADTALLSASNYIIECLETDRNNWSAGKHSSFLDGTLFTLVQMIGVLLDGYSSGVAREEKVLRAALLLFRKVFSIEDSGYVPPIIFSSLPIDHVKQLLRYIQCPKEIPSLSFREGREQTKKLLGALVTECGLTELSGFAREVQQQYEGEEEKRAGLFATLIEKRLIERASASDPQWKDALPVAEDLILAYALSDREEEWKEKRLAFIYSLIEKRFGKGCREQLEQSRGRLLDSLKRG